MKLKYKGFDIEAKREKCLAGYSLMYYSTLKDGYEYDYRCEESNETVHNAIEYLKKEVDYLIDCLNKKICPHCENNLDNKYYCKECNENFDQLI